MIGKDLSLAIRLLNAGELVAIPTETVYGLAANGLDPLSVSKIFAAKNRPHFDPLILHLDSTVHLLELVDAMPHYAERLAEHFWPGPLTMLLPKSQLVPDLVTAGSPLVAVRVPNHPLTLELLKALSFPLAAPSANPFGYISPTRAEHVEAQLGDKISYILDGGPSEIGLESTIVDCSGDEPVVKRLGGITIDALCNCLGFEPKVDIQSHSNPSSPGLLDQHYAPRKPLYLVEDIEAFCQAHSGKSILYLSFGANTCPEGVYEMNLSPKGDLIEAASHLFHYMRALDSHSGDCIVAKRLPDNGLGKAINDRLYRAAHK